jgi:hypothetical protein
MDEDGRDTSARPSQGQKAKGQNHARAMLDEGIVFPDIPPPVPKLDVANPTFEEG